MIAVTHLSSSASFQMRANVSLGSLDLSRMACAVLGPRCASPSANLSKSSSNLAWDWSTRVMMRFACISATHLGVSLGKFNHDFGVDFIWQRVWQRVTLQLRGRVRVITTRQRSNVNQQTAKAMRCLAVMNSPTSRRSSWSTSASVQISPRVLESRSELMKSALATSAAATHQSISSICDCGMCAPPLRYPSSGPSAWNSAEYLSRSSVVIIPVTASSTQGGAAYGRTTKQIKNHA